MAMQAHVSSSQDPKFDEVVKVRTLVGYSKMVAGQVSEIVEQRIMTQLQAQDRQRTQIENERANHRNVNRMLTLVGAILIGLTLTFVLTHGYLGHFGTVISPYTFVITVLLDASLAAYSMVKHY